MFDTIWVYVAPLIGIFLIGGVKALHTHAKNNTETEMDDKFWSLVLDGLKLLFKKKQ